ncbi:hypothetical protein GGI20_003725 [Coemansia sp. BCRC 34301]|nr:hypothetical protein GGI20_003725 [Coemansia sp. BCRC 34301]
MAVLAFTGGVSTEFHCEEIDPRNHDGLGVRGPAIAKFRSAFGLSTWEPVVYAVDGWSTVQLTENNDEISYATRFVCVAMEDVIRPYLDNGTLFDHLMSFYAPRKKSQ